MTDALIRVPAEAAESCQVIIVRFLPSPRRVMYGLVTGTMTFSLHAFSRLKSPRGLDEF